MIHPQRRPVVIITAVVLAVFAAVWLVGSRAEVVSEQNWFAPLALILLFLSSLITYIRSRTVSLMRPWLVRHLIGNLVLAIGVLLVWRFDLAPLYYLALGICIFLMWTWATRKLREAIHKGG